MSESTTLNSAADAALADGVPSDGVPTDSAPSAAAVTTILTPPRIFCYNGQTIIDKDQDPGPEFSPQMILDHLKATNIYPELSNAKIEIRQSTLADGTIQIEFVKSGTKGGDNAGTSWPTWIGVGERLPESGQEVLVISNKGCINLMRFVHAPSGTPMWESQWSDQSRSYSWEVGSVTHWIPLPPAPELPQLEARQ